MGRKAKAEAKERAKERAEQLRVAIRERSVAFGGAALGLVGVARVANDAAPIILPICGAVLVGFFWLRKRWMQDYREALAAAGIDPDHDEEVERSASLKSTLLILFGVFGGMFLFLSVFMWLARK